MPAHEVLLHLDEGLGTVHSQTGAFLLDEFPLGVGRRGLFLLAADRAARRAGALGTKVCGAGGGGCLVAFAAEGRAEGVGRAMAGAGAQLLDAAIARAGVRVQEDD